MTRLGSGECGDRWKEGRQTQILNFKGTSKLAFFYIFIVFSPVSQLPPLIYRCRGKMRQQQVGEARKWRRGKVSRVEGMSEASASGFTHDHKLLTSSGSCVVTA